MPATISTSEVVLAVASGIAVLLHIVALARADRDLTYARREGIGNGSMILFRQNLRTEAARLHLKATLFLAACYFLTRPHPPGWGTDDWILVAVALAVVHLNGNAVLDIRDRERIKRKHARARDAGWSGPDRRAT